MCACVQVPLTIKVAGTIAGVSQTILRFTHKFVKTLADNPQATKCMHTQFIVKSVGSEWPRGVEEPFKKRPGPRSSH